MLEGDVGGSCGASQKNTPEEYHEGLMEVKKHESLPNGFTKEWKDSVDLKLDSQETNVERRQGTQNLSISLMQLMLGNQKGLLTDTCPRCLEKARTKAKAP